VTAFGMVVVAAAHTAWSAGFAPLQVMDIFDIQFYR